MYFKKKIQDQSGQVLLAVVLVMVVSLTLGLSIASKSITSFKTSVEEADSQKALRAAEAGIERAIQTQASIPAGTFDSSAYTTTVTDTNVPSLLLNAGNQIVKDEGIDLWLTEYPDYDQPADQIQSVTFYWGTNDQSCDNPASPIPALYVSLISGTKNNPTLKRYAYDPCETRRSLNKMTQAASGFSNVTAGTQTVGGVTFNYRATISPITNGLIARVLPLYGSGIIGVSSPLAFPSQGKIISSTGTSGNSQRKVTVFQGFPAVPGELFPYNVFSTR